MRHLVLRSCLARLLAVSRTLKEGIMAKCFRVVGQGVPVRMSDDDAFQVVIRDGDGEYCSKKFWRDWYMDKPTMDGMIGRLVGTTITPVETLSRQLQYKREKKHGRSAQG
jgi:hypothetical protein